MLLSTAAVEHQLVCVLSKTLSIGEAFALIHPQWKVIVLFLQACADLLSVPTKFSSFKILKWLQEGFSLSV